MSQVDGGPPQITIAWMVLAHPLRTFTCHPPFPANLIRAKSYDVRTIPRGAHLNRKLGKIRNHATIQDPLPTLPFVESNLNQNVSAAGSICLNCNNPVSKHTDFCFKHGPTRTTAREAIATHFQEAYQNISNVINHIGNLRVSQGIRGCASKPLLK